MAIDNGIDPDVVAVTPMGVDRANFYDTPLGNDERTTFVNVGKWEYRKGQDVLLEAFRRAFTPGDAVELRFLSHNPWSSADDSRWMELCKRSPMADHISALPCTHGRSDVADVMRARLRRVTARVGRLEPRALEMLSCGRHVIATPRTRAPREYLDSSNALLVDVDELEPASDPLWMPVYTEHKTGDGRDSVSASSSNCSPSPYRASTETGRHFGLNAAGVRTAERYPWERTAHGIVDAFENLAHSSAPAQLKTRRSCIRHPRSVRVQVSRYMPPLTVPSSVGMNHLPRLCVLPSASKT